MNGFAPLLAAIALAQEPAVGAPPAGETPAPEPAAIDAGGAIPTTAPTTTPTTTKTPARAPAAIPTTRQRAPPGPTRPTPVVKPGEAAGPSAKASPSGSPAERADAERVSRAFVAALARGDGDALSELCAERFSFDGDSRSGREAVRRTWRALLAGRAAPVPTPGRIEVLSLADAVARHGRPPARLASLARPDALVAIADVGGRTVVLFLAREGERLAVTGMHD